MGDKYREIMDSAQEHSDFEIYVADWAKTKDNPLGWCCASGAWVSVIHQVLDLGPFTLVCICRTGGTSYERMKGGLWITESSDTYRRRMELLKCPGTTTGRIRSDVPNVSAEPKQIVLFEREECGPSVLLHTITTYRMMEARLAASLGIPQEYMESNPYGGMSKAMDLAEKKDRYIREGFQCKGTATGRIRSDAPNKQRLRPLKKCE